MENKLHITVKLQLENYRGMCVELAKTLGSSVLTLNTIVKYKNTMEAVNKGEASCKKRYTTYSKCAGGNNEKLIVDNTCFQHPCQCQCHVAWKNLSGRYYFRYWEFLGIKRLDQQIQKKVMWYTKVCAANPVLLTMKMFIISWKEGTSKVVCTQGHF